MADHVPNGEDLRERIEAIRTDIGAAVDAATAPGIDDASAHQRQDRLQTVLTQGLNGIARATGQDHLRVADSRANGTRMPTGASTLRTLQSRLDRGLDGLARATRAVSPWAIGLNVLAIGAGAAIVGLSLVPGGIHVAGAVGFLLTAGGTLGAIGSATQWFDDRARRPARLRETADRLPRIRAELGLEPERGPANAPRTASATPLANRLTERTEPDGTRADHTLTERPSRSPSA